MDPYLQVMVQIIVVLGILILILLFFLVLLRQQSLYREARYNDWARAWESFYHGYILGDYSLKDLPGYLVKGKSFAWLRRFFTPFLEVLDGPDFEATKALCRETGLIAHCQGKLKKGSIPQRAEAAKFLGLLRCQISVPERLIMLKSRRPLLVLAAAQSLVVSGEPGTFQQVLQALLFQTYLTYEGATEILSRYGREICQPITEILAQYKGEKENNKSVTRQRKAKRITPAHGINETVFLIIMIDLLGHYRYKKALLVLGSLLPAANEEMCIHLFKTFLRIGAAPTQLNLRDYLEHEAWPVRSFAAQVASLSKDETSLHLLNDLLTDSQWWVRYHAAMALATFGQQGRELLARRIDGSDAEAAYISSYILSRGKVS